MRLRLAETDQSEGDDLDITPMIDVVFLLILFFMLTSTFIEESKVFKIVLPKADEPQTITRDDVDSISITVDGEYFFRTGADDEQLPDLETLLDKLQQRPADQSQRPVIIRCDARCEYSQFMQVKNVLKLAGINTIYEEVEVRDEDKKEP
ncbi:MAG: biopolymer transporter ExbD [Planctomycetota bacterium]|jgi:biopolymer transport protein ExbD|nr:biopolymer transporter ExbD [Planctomycetota bacterium]MDP7130009.1 biopolymer transporter ExbD [Planctomycetota bacterium]MDP7249200.1 biopolymer transporter ExbD [Planctomycetota bacterium]